MPGQLTNVSNQRSKELTHSIRTMSQVINVPKGSCLYFKGEAPRMLFLLVKGNVVVAGPSVKRIEFMPKNKIMGIKEILLDEELKQTAFACTNAQLLAVRRDDFLNLVNSSPDFRRMCMQHICQQLMVLPARVFE